MTRPATLRGDRHTIREVSALALDTILPATSREWLLRLAWVLRDRRDALRELRQAGHGAQSRDVVRRGERFGAVGTTWWVVMSVGTLLVIAGAALLLPPRHSSARTLADGLWEAPPLMIAGALVLCVLALLPVPGVVRESATAVGAALAAGALALVALGFNATRLEELRATEHGTRTDAYLLAATAALIASAVLALRARERRPHYRVHWRKAARQAFGHARWLLRETPVAQQHRAVLREWQAALTRLGADADPEVVAQARSLGPWHFLVAACYDGEVEVPQIPVPRVTGNG